MATFDFIEGFDYYPTNVSQAGIGVMSTWIRTGGAYNPALIEGRFLPGKAFAHNPGPGPHQFTRVVPPHSRKAFGFALRLTDLGGQGEGVGIHFLELQDDVGSVLYRIHCNLLGQMYIWSAGDNQTRLATEREVLNNTWHYHEILIHHEVEGRLQYFIDGQEQFNVTGNLRGGTRADIGRIRMVANFTQSPRHFDDMYMQSDAEDVLGECRIHMLEPSEDVEVAWTGNPGGGNFGNVDDASVDSDATYNYSNTVGAKDLFRATQIDVNPSVIHAVGTVMAARKEDSGTRTIRSKVRSGIHEADGQDNNLTTDYIWTRDVFERDPNGNIPWSKSRVNDLNVGYELVL